MTSKFNYNGKERPFKVDKLKPSALARVFHLDESSLVLTDEEGNCYMPEGESFDLPLNSGQIFIVDGIELSGNSTEEIQEKQLAIKTFNEDLMNIQGKGQQDMINDVITNCSNLDESANMLYNGPQAVVLVQALAIMAVCAPDPSLNVQSLNQDIVARLGDPESFRASLLHVANNMCNAFRQGDYAMKKIRAALIDLPDYFEATLEVVGQDNNETAKKILSRTVEHLSEASATSKKMATLAKDAFDEVIKDIDALSVAATSSKTRDEREIAELKKLKEEMDIRQEQLKAEEERLKVEYEEAQARSKEALKEYREKVDQSSNLGKLFLATLTDGVFDVLKAGISLQKEVLSVPKDMIVSAAQALNPFGHETIKCSGTMKYAVVSIKFMRNLLN
uniref:Uncharacterized protein n=1 Tax=Panagrolaimus superbus TaxID=310955 RepID=A0A914ZAA3_9BILA